MHRKDALLSYLEQVIIIGHLMTLQRREVTKEEIINEFRRVRDEIELTIQKFHQRGCWGYMPIISMKAKMIILNKKKILESKFNLFANVKGYSLKELAAKLQITEDYLSKTEKNLTEPSKYFHSSFGFCLSDELR